MGRGLSARADLAMPNGEQPEVQHRLRTLNPRLEEWSAVSASTGHAGELVASPSVSSALAAGGIVAVTVTPTLADGLAGNLEEGAVTIEVLLRHHVPVV